jgi:phosphopantetheinyl transferase (holo-ACP synthase)
LGLIWNENGAPQAVLTGSAAAQYGHIQLAVSISHSGDTAFATCVALEE